MTIPSFVIGIAGGTGAGKTTVAREISDAVAAGDADTEESGALTRLPLDNYYRDLSHLEMDEREAVNYDHPSAFEWDLIHEHVESLLLGQPVEMPQYDFTVHNRTDETVRVEPSEVVVVEGIFALYEERLLEKLDLKVYVETDADVRILRRIRRDVIVRGWTMTIPSFVIASAGGTSTASSTSTSRRSNRCTSSSSSRPNATPT